MTEETKRGRWRWIPIVGLALVMVMPSGAADPLIESCDRGTGFATRDNSYICVEYSFEFPDEVYDTVFDQPVPPATPNATTEECPEDSNGTIVHVGDAHAGDCFKIFYRTPGRPMSSAIWIDLSPECEIGPAPGEDPRVTIWGGGVGVCHKMWLDPGNGTIQEMPEYSLEPCSRNPDESVDPEVTWKGGAVYLCVRYGI